METPSKVRIYRNKSSLIVQKRTGSQTKSMSISQRQFDDAHNIAKAIAEHLESGEDFEEVKRKLDRMKESRVREQPKDKLKAAINQLSSAFANLKAALEDLNAE